MHDLVIRSGVVVDGTGRDRFVADIAVDGGLISAVGQVDEPGRHEIDASGLVVAPGWVDIHTHYDGQIMWDPDASPAPMSGVTSVVMGNCSVGFAPVRGDQHELLINMMSCVEDIPAESLKAGIPFNWSTYPEYLNILSGKACGVDFAVQVPHAALRWYVMGDRAQDGDPTDAELEAMQTLLREALDAGAAGLSTSRAQAHYWERGPLPGTDAKERELLALGSVLAERKGVFSIVTQHSYEPAERAWIAAVAEMGATVTLPCLQYPFAPEAYKDLMQWAEDLNRRGLSVRPQVPARSLGSIRCWDSSGHLFADCASYMAIAHLPMAERLPRLRDPAVRQAILGEFPAHAETAWQQYPYGLFKLGDPPQYEPTQENNCRAVAAAKGVAPEAVVYDWMLEREGTELVFGPFANYDSGDLAVAFELLSNENSVLGLSDGGAHCTMLCDLAQSTFLLTHWVRDRVRGPKLRLEDAVRLQTAKTAEAWGLSDRGRIEVGLRADLNIIDLEGLRLHAPEMAYDVPAGGRRLVQRVEGYEATILNGEVIQQHGVRTDAHPGRLIRCGAE